MAGFRIESRCAQWILVAVLLSGCGGGGGGGGGASAPTTASTEPEPPPTLAVRVAGLGTDYATGAIESILETGQLAVDFLDKASRSAASTFVEPCSNGGRASVSLPVDANLDGKPGAGDTLRVILTNCSVQALGAVATGEFTVRLEAPPGGFVKAYRGLLAFGSSFDLEGTGLVGELRIDYRQSALETVLAIEPGPRDLFQVVVPDPRARITETYRSPRVFKSVRYFEARTVVGGSVTVDSDAFQSQLAITTPIELSGYFNTYPDRGSVRVAFADRSIVEWTAVATVNPASGNEFADLRIDPAGNGRFEAFGARSWTQGSDGFLWSEPRSNAPTDGKYPTQPFRPNAFSVLFADAGSNVSVRPEVVVQLSRELDPTALPTLRFYTGVEAGTIGVDVDADIRLSGARLVIVPRMQLEHGRSYVIGPVPANGFGARIQDRGGNVAALPELRLTTANTLVADAQTSALFAVAGASIELNASGSTALEGAIQSYRWHQLSGRTATIQTPNAARTLVTVNAPSRPEGEVLLFEVEVVNSLGETDRALVRVHSFASFSSARIIYFRSATTDFMGQGATAVLSSASGTVEQFPSSIESVSLRYLDSPGNESPFRGMSLQLAAIEGRRLVPGAYDNAEQSPFPRTVPILSMLLRSPTCTTQGRFNVLEIQRDAFDVITKLAVDIDQRCGGTLPTLFASVRINSAIPIRP